jgi:hypothetical protein
MTTATCPPIKRLRRRTYNTALGIFLGSLLGNLIALTVWGAPVPAAVIAMVASGLVVTSYVIARGGTQ